MRLATMKRAIDSLQVGHAAVEALYFYLKVWLGDLGQSSYVMKEKETGRTRDHKCRQRME